MYDYNILVKLLNEYLKKFSKKSIKFDKLELVKKESTLILELPYHDKERPSIIIYISIVKEKFYVTITEHNISAINDMVDYIITINPNDIKV